MDRGRRPPLLAGRSTGGLQNRVKNTLRIAVSSRRDKWCSSKTFCGINRSGSSPAALAHTVRQRCFHSAIQLGWQAKLQSHITSLQGRIDVDAVLHVC